MAIRVASATAVAAAKGGVTGGTAAAASVLLAAEDAVAVVYGFLLFALPSNCRRIFMCTYTDCSSTQVIEYTGTL